MNENEEGNIEENREDGFEIINSGEDVSSLIKSVSALSGIDPSCKYLDWQYIVHNFRHEDRSREFCKEMKEKIYEFNINNIEELLDIRDCSLWNTLSLKVKNIPKYSL